MQLTFIEWISALKKEKNFGSIYHDIKVKSLKQGQEEKIFSHIKEEKF